MWSPLWDWSGPLPSRARTEAFSARQSPPIPRLSVQPERRARRRAGASSRVRGVKLFSVNGGPQAGRAARFPEAAGRPHGERGGDEEQREAEPPVQADAHLPEGGSGGG